MRKKRTEESGRAEEATEGPRKDRNEEPEEEHHHEEKRPQKAPGRTGTT